MMAKNSEITLFALVTAFVICKGTLITSTTMSFNYLKLHTSLDI